MHYSWRVEDRGACSVPYIPVHSWTHKNIIIIIIEVQFFTRAVWMCRVSAVCLCVSNHQHQFIFNDATQQIHRRLCRWIETYNSTLYREKSLAFLWCARNNSIHKCTSSFATNGDGRGWMGFKLASSLLIIFAIQIKNKSAPANSTRKQKKKTWMKWVCFAASTSVLEEHNDEDDRPSGHGVINN